MHRFAALLALGALIGACGSDDVATLSRDPGAGQGDIAEAAVPADASDVLTTPLETPGGDPITLADYDGKPIVVNLWASWCTFCIAEMPDFEEVNQALDGGVQFVGVNIDAEAERGMADELAAETGVTYDLIYDPTTRFGETLGALAMPSTAFIDANGEIVELHSGQLDADRLRSLVDEHLLG